MIMSEETQTELLEFIYDETAYAYQRLAAIASVMLLNNCFGDNKRPWAESWQGVHKGVSLGIFCRFLLEAEPRKQRTPEYLNAAALWVEAPEVYLPCTKLTFKTDVEMTSFEFILELNTAPETENGLMELAIEDFSAYLLDQTQVKSA